MNVKRLSRRPRWIILMNGRSFVTGWNLLWKGISACNLISAAIQSIQNMTPGFKLPWSGSWLSLPRPAWLHKITITWKLIMKRLWKCPKVHWSMSCHGKNDMIGPRKVERCLSEVLKDQSTYLYIHYLSKGLVPCPILSLSIVLMTPALSRARICWLACCWPLHCPVSRCRLCSSPRFIHRVQTPVGYFHNYFSDQNYSICFTNSIWSVLLSPLIIPPLLRLCHCVHYWLCRNVADNSWLLSPRHRHVLASWRLIWRC